ncbi:response regulator [bacterium]|nr:response regulator [bacterium]
MQVGAQVFYDVFPKPADNPFAEKRFSVVVCYRMAPSVLDELMANNAAISFVNLLDETAADWAQLIKLPFADELVFSESDAFVHLLNTKLNRLIESRFNKRLLGVLNALLAVYPLPIIVTRQIKGGSERVVFYNDVYLKASGFNSEDLFDKPFDLWRYYTQNQSFVEDESNIMVCGFLHPDGIDSERDVQLVAISQPDGANITYRLALEYENIHGKGQVSQLEQQVKIMSQRVKGQEEFLASVAHDIRKPLNNIIGLVDLLNETPLDEEQQYISNSLTQSGRNLKNLINDLLSLSKIDSANFEISNAFFNIRTLVSGMQLMFQNEATSRGLKLKFTVDDLVPAMLEGDENRLSQILINLLGNALKFTREGRVSLRVSLLKMSDRKAQVRFEVSDTGIGIKKEDQRRIFESFEQAKTDKSHEGTGLGLTICQRLCQLMHGQISLHSEWQVGSTFTVDLPFELAALADNKEAEKEEKDLGELQILLIDDSELTSFVIEKLLTRWNAHVKVAPNGTVAPQLFGQLPFDLVITDIQLPDMSGLKLATKIKSAATSQNRYLPIIGISAFPYPSTQIAYHQIDGFFLKPINTGELYEKIVNLYENRNLLTTSFNSTSMDYQIIDTNRIRKFASNDAEFMKQVVEIFLKRTPEYIKELRDAVADKDWERIKMMAHKVKPTFTYVGMEAFTEKVGAIENYAIKRDLQTIETIMDEVWDKCQVAFVEFDDFLKSLDEFV